MNILHLSDIHFGRNYSRTGIKEKFERKEKILDELIDCIKKLDSCLQPEHIVVTGDIAWWGKEDEYQEAFTWFQQLLCVTNLSGRDITFCPGNHDADRNHASHHPELTDNSITEIDQIYEYNNVHRMASSFLAYSNFCEAIGMEPYAYPADGKLEYSYCIGYKDVTSQSGKTIRLISFNTALLSALPNISEDKMWIGQAQITELMRYGIIPADASISYSIALLHHAERFLNPNEICEYNGRPASFPLLRKQVDLVLCGHTETGGKPVLTEQIGGSKLLTAGATYYNDDHPNSFSIICIPDNPKNMTYCPYVYAGTWKQYPPDSNDFSIEKIKELPPTGEIKGMCELILGKGSHVYTLPLKTTSVTEYTKDGTAYVRFDNRKDVLRLLDVAYDGPKLGGSSFLKFNMSYKMENNVRAMLERETLYAFTNEASKVFGKIPFRIEHIPGKIICSGSLNPEPIDVKQSDIDLLSDMVKIEEEFGIKLCRPKDVFERDYQIMHHLLQLINTGYIDSFSLQKIIKLPVSNKQKIKGLLMKAISKNQFFLQYTGDFVCELFGVQIKLNNMLILSGNYHVDKLDLLHKLFSFKDGDIRQCLFNAAPDVQTFFIRDVEKANQSINIKLSGTSFGANLLSLKFDDFIEVPKKSNNQ